MENIHLHLKNQEIITKVALLPTNVQNELLKLAAAGVYQPHSPTNLDVIDTIKELHISERETYELLGLFMKLIKMLMHLDKQHRHTVLQTNGFPQQFVENFCTNVYESNPLPLRSMNANRLNMFKWRIDISFLSGETTTKIPPLVLIKIRFIDGTTYCCQMDAKAFHTFRFNISLACKKVGLLQRRLVQTKQ